MVRPEDEMPAAKKKDKQLMEDAKKADAAAEEHRDTPEKKRARMEELEQRAQLFGDSVKQSYNAQCLERKWQRFLLVHGDEIGFSEKKGPTLKHVQRFTTYCFCTRDVDTW